MLSIKYTLREQPSYALGQSSRLIEQILRRLQRHVRQMEGSELASMW